MAWRWHLSKGMGTWAYDLLVIGSGPAGEKAAVKAAYFGKRVAIVERAAVGGRCALSGLPSKVLRERALAFRAARQNLSGVLAPDALIGTPMQRLVAAASRVCVSHGARVRGNLERHGLEVFRGGATFLDPHTVVVRSDHDVRELTAEFVVIATGSRPIRPAGIPFDETRVFCTDGILAMKHLPRSLAVVGAGVIGTEYASIFASLGVEVTLFNRSPALLGFLDREIAACLRTELERSGVQLMLGKVVEECSTGSGAVSIRASTGEVSRFEAVLYSCGRAPNVEELDLARAGVGCGKHGHPIVDAFFRTSAPHIYAAGDVVGAPGLASTSMEQGRIAVGHAFTFPETLPNARTAPDDLLPQGIYTVPAVSMVGITEQRAQGEGLAYAVGTSRYEDHDRAQLTGDAGGLLKLVCERETLRLLGVHVAGASAEELVHVGQAVMHHGGTIECFLRSVFNFPTMGGLYKAAAYDVLTRLGREARDSTGRQTPAGLSFSG